MTKTTLHLHVHDWLRKGIQGILTQREHHTAYQDGQVRLTYPVRDLDALLRTLATNHVLFHGHGPGREDTYEVFAGGRRQYVRTTAHPTDHAPLARINPNGDVHCHDHQAAQHYWHLYLAYHTHGTDNGVS